jgi:alanyl-tRNA synthetase
MHKAYGLDEAQDRTVRIVADHIRTAVELTIDGVVPGPKEQGYLLRRLIRRAFRRAKLLHIDHEKTMKEIFAECVRVAQNIYSLVDTSQVANTILDEIDKYIHTFDNGKKIIAKYIRTRSVASLRGVEDDMKPRSAGSTLLYSDKVGNTIGTISSISLTGQDVFNLYQSIGVPAEEVIEMVTEQGGSVNMEGFEEAKQKHSELSRSGSEQKFKGGLADQSEQVVKYHTATHLLHQALCNILGDSVRQEGSNITGERLRFDFHCDRKPTPEDIMKVASIIQNKIPIH